MSRTRWRLSKVSRSLSTACVAAAIVAGCSSGETERGGQAGAGGSAVADGAVPGSGGSDAGGGSGGAAGGAGSGGAASGTGGTSSGSGGITSGSGGVTSGSGGANGGSGGAMGGGGSGTSFNPPYILGADISWTLQHESTGAKYQDKGQTKSVERIFVDHGFNYVRLRTFVCPNCSGGYASGATVAWCDTAHTIMMAKRVKACRMGVFLDFHMSDNWASIGHQEMPSAWAGMSASQMQSAAYTYVKGTLQQMVAAGVKPDMVQIGNETNSAMSGVSMSNWANFSGLVNAGIRAVRETDPAIFVWAQHGRPRPDGGFEPWVDSYLAKKPPIDVDGICGSTYGTTNNGDDWRQEFGYVINKYKLPVMSCEYTDQRRALINPIMHGFANQMGRGTFLWEPTTYEYPLFDRSGNTFTTNSRMPAYDALAKSYGLPVPSTPAAQLESTTCR